MTMWQQLVTIGLCTLGTMMTRYLPFIVFASSKPTPKYVQYLGKALPPAIFSMLVVYCLKDISVFSGTRALPELLAILSIIGIHLWKKNTLLSIFTGTAIYMLLVQLLFPWLQTAFGLFV